VKIDAAFDEDTPDAVLATRVAAWKRLGPTRRGRVAQRLLEIEAEQIRTFFHSLEQAILRRIKTILVIPLHGTPLECPSVDDAISKIANYREAENKMPVVRYEIEIRYNNSDTIVARF
jgi:hypothetical protein